MRSRNPRQGGFTLVEVLVAIAVLSIVGLALAGTFAIGARTINQQAREIAADTAVSQASMSLVRDYSSASSVSTGTISSGSGSLTVTAGSPATTVTYTIDANQNLIRTVGAAASVAARGLSSLTVATGNPACYLTLTIQPSAVGAAAKTLNVGIRTGGCF